MITNVIRDAWYKLFGSPASQRRSSDHRTDHGQLPPYAEDKTRKSVFMLKNPAQDYVEAKVRFARDVLETIDAEHSADGSRRVRGERP